jgi:lipid-A-disaccharide synthase
MSLKIAIVVGELSGDLLAAGLIGELKKIFPNLQAEGIVGPNLINIGAKELFNMRHLSLMGLIEPLLNLPKLIYIRSKLYRKILQNKPDLFIGVDAPEFNLGLEKKLKQANITTVHYVSPSVWAWRSGRIKLIKKAVDLMLTLFPFEVNFYQQHLCKAICVGHFLADQIPMIIDAKSAKQRLGFSEYDKILTIMPGSRNSELKHLTAIYLETIKQISLRFAHLKFIMPVINQQHKIYIEELIKKIASRVLIKVIVQDSNTAIAAADFVLVTSGTATLEVMLHKKPMVVAYKTNFITYLLVKKLIKVKYISLPNLLADKAIVPEFIQDEVTPYKLIRALSDLISRGGPTTEQITVFNQIHQELKKDASNVAAQEIVKLLKV